MTVSRRQATFGGISLLAGASMSTLKRVQANYSAWHGHSFGWHVEPVWYEPKFSIVLYGIDFVDFSSESDARRHGFRRCHTALPYGESSIASEGVMEALYYSAIP